MKCKACEELETGTEYELSNGKCFKCDFPAPAILGVYVGKSKDGRYHVFQHYHNYRCHNCGHGGDNIAYPCSELDVTDEFKFLSNTKDSHWIGKKAG